MTTPNHIAGGLVFTGTMLSFYNENLFSSPYYIGACVIASLLPDIDTPQTLTGKAVYPLALFINRKVGHRTLTHSLLFFGFIWLFLAFFTKLLGLPSVYVKVVLFGFLSHLILDMLTIQGVPLFYPFKRNPCVLPADPHYRFKTSNPKSEIIVFTVFILLSFLMFPLFSQGFWTTYNRKFGTISHCDRENTNSKNWVQCEYEYTKNNLEYSGTAYILESTEKKLTLFNNDVFTLDVDDKTLHISTTKPLMTDQPKKIHELNFMNIPIDSVNNLMNNRICSGMLQSNFNVKYVDRGITYNSNFIKFSNSYNFKVLAVVDTAKLDLVQQLDKVKARIKKDSLQQIEKQVEFNNLHAKKMILINKITDISDNNLYEKNKLQNELIEIDRKIKNFELKPVSIDIVLLKEKETIENQLKNSNPLLFSGYITYYIFESNENQHNSN